MPGTLHPGIDKNSLARAWLVRRLYFRRKHDGLARTLASCRLAVCLAALLGPAFPAAAAPAADIEAGFVNPPESARPRTWWHWVSGNVSPEGITADLEAMKRVGLGGAQLFTVDQSDVHGP